MSEAESRRLEREADKRLFSPKAKQVRWRIERETFDEEDGRAMYGNVAGSSGARSRVVPEWESGRLSVEAGADVIRHCLFAGRLTSGAVLSRLLALAVQMGELSVAEAARISRKSVRTIQRNGGTKRPAKAHKY